MVAMTMLKMGADMIGRTTTRSSTTPMTPDSRDGETEDQPVWQPIPDQQRVTDKTAGHDEFAWRSSPRRGFYRSRQIPGPPGHTHSRSPARSPPDWPGSLSYGAISTPTLRASAVLPLPVPSSRSSSPTCLLHHDETCGSAHDTAVIAPSCTSAPPGSQSLMVVMACNNDSRCEVAPGALVTLPRESGFLIPIEICHIQGSVEHTSAYRRDTDPGRDRISRRRPHFDPMTSSTCLPAQFDRLIQHDRRWADEQRVVAMA